MAEGTITLTDGDFDAQVLKSSEPVLVDFWAEWCAPCRSLAPIVEEVARANAGRLKVGKMNIDENPLTPGKYSVRAIPTMLLFKDGHSVEQIVGLVNKAKLQALLDKHL